MLLPYRLIAFDLDDTLAVTKSPISPTMAELLTDLLDRFEVCVISGGQIVQFTTQVIDNLPARARLDRLHLMPTCGTRYDRYDRDAEDGTGGWRTVYAENLTAAERDAAVAVLTAGMVELGLAGEQTWGPLVEDRGSQVTLSALGQAAPAEAKYAWDPTGAKKERLRAYAAQRLPGLEVRSGGSTSVDVTRKGIDKAYGIGRLVEHTGLRLDQIFFVGDRLDAGGNDRPVLDLGVTCAAVHGPADTERVIGRILRPVLL